jgi:hypothetical protein
MVYVIRCNTFKSFVTPNPLLADLFAKRLFVVCYVMGSLNLPSIEYISLVCVEMLVNLLTIVLLPN